MKKVNSIQVEDKAKCCGCAACEDVCPKKAISLQVDEEGFHYPQINGNLCVGCGMCISVCPIRSETVQQITNKPIEIYAARSKDSEVLKNSSSGAMFTYFSDRILQARGVVYGAARDNALITKHIRTETPEERDACRGSKYVQSDMNHCYRLIEQDLHNGKKVLFTGVACQCAAVQSYLKVRKCDMSNLITMDIVCHGVPSPMLYSEFIEFAGKKKKSQVVSHFHRPKDFGWSHQEKLIFANGTTDNQTMLSQVWRRLFYSENMQRPSCYACPFVGRIRPADISVGDFWGIGEFLPEYNDKKGISFVLLNTEKGLDVFNEALDLLEKTPVEWDWITKKQERLRGQPVVAKERKQFWTVYREKGFDGIARKYGGYVLKRRLKNYVKRLLKLV
ncbi:4Fe-4S ferredoxin iron-sulfur binding domain protein [Clostridium clostridioforme CAG:132]|uniref:4Fe-4S ferredoxin iron-sulfur binding domain protein n=1 Tax=[Clostridium] clostridioforme CAG:132 TaxID=1263065 RepID=R6JRC1_9FIRM|nr:Coenzyme F420 hydrogenase/dehydrogenase, beta subunit C-terminal domain [Enterocloster clostridioformis]CDB63855.1 4Fe-4S ferredoxin iron-sulfur binding domain protein [[Clostridium] clostridioforme CAG:132]